MRESESKPPASFSWTYRHELAEQLMEERDRFARRQILSNAQPTFVYRLTKAETIARRKGSDLGPIYPVEQLVKERVLTNEYFSAIASDEQHLYMLFDAVRERCGAVIGVGVEQVLNIFCNSKADRAYIFDAATSNALLTQTFLEIGVRHKKIFGRFPSGVEFIEYFKNLDVLEGLLPEIIGQDQVQSFIKKLQGGRHTSYGNVSLHEYLRFNNGAVDEEGEHYAWVADENLPKVLAAYGEGRITVMVGNLLNAQAMEKLAENICNSSVPVSMIYLSNVKDYLERKQVSKLDQNFRLLPLADEVVVLNTFNSRPLSREVKPGEGELERAAFVPWHYVAEKIHPENPGDSVTRGITDFINWVKIHTSHGVTFLGFRKEELNRH